MAPGRSLSPDRSNARFNFLENLKPFTGDPGLERHKTRNIAARPRHACCKTCIDRIGDLNEYDPRRTLLREYDKWAKDHPDDATNMGGMVFFTYLQKEKSDLLDFHAVGGDKWATVHGWLYYTGRVR